MSGHEDAEQNRRYRTPYDARHPIPTISKYREEKAARQEEALKGDHGAHHGPPVGESHPPTDGGQQGPSPDEDHGDQDTQGKSQKQQQQQQQQQPQREKQDAPVDTSEIDPSATDPRQRMKNKKHHNAERAEREVTDPVTHLPVTIQDFTDQALEDADVNGASPHSSGIQHTTSGLSDKTKHQKLRDDQQRQDRDHQSLTNRFSPRLRRPPP